MCEPKNRDLRPSLCGLLRSRMTVKVMMPASTPTANRSSMNPMNAQCPIAGMAKVAGEQGAVGLDDRQQQDDEAPERQPRAPPRAPTTSAACAARSPRWPGPPTSRPGCSRTAATRSGAGWPAERQPLQPPQPAPRDANATAVRTRPTVIRTTTRTSSDPELKRSHAGPATSRAGLVTASPPIVPTGNLRRAGGTSPPVRRAARVSSEQRITTGRRRGGRPESPQVVSLGAAVSRERHRRRESGGGAGIIGDSVS